jgi:hypothetical protein
MDLTVAQTQKMIISFTNSSVGLEIHIGRYQHPMSNSEPQTSFTLQFPCVTMLIHRGGHGGPTWRFLLARI